MPQRSSGEETVVLFEQRLRETRTETLLRRIPESETFSRRAYRLLHHPTRGKYQDPRGGYGWRTHITHRNFERHLLGLDSIALGVVHGEKANFLCIDLDAEFERRLRVFAEVLRNRGLHGASFAINGSALGRGKVVVTLQERLPRRQAKTLVESIVAEATADPRFGKYKSKDLTTFPQGGDGSHVRLFGRNLKRSWHRGLLEVPLDLDGDLCDLSGIEPANVVADLPGCAVMRSSFSAWARTFMDVPYEGHTGELFSAQARLAREAVALYGQAKARGFLTDTFSKLEAQSPNLSASSRRNLLRSDVIDKVIEYAAGTRLVTGNHNISDYIRFPGNKISTAAARVYDALAQYVLDYGLDPNCFGITFDRIADLAGYATKSKAWEGIQGAIGATLMLRLDTGSPKQNGLPGLCGLYALVGNHNPSVVLAAGQQTTMYQERNEERVKRGLAPLPTSSPELPVAA